MKDYTKSLTPSRSRVEKFLVSNELVVTGTDKNLGIAVSKRQWIEDKCLNLLQDTANYKPIPDPLMLNAYLAKQNELADEVATLAESISNGTQIAKFLRSKMTPFIIKNNLRIYEKHHVPVFYGIPKIHKEPVKMRPIIPCHSAIQNPAAKFVSKKLKPIIQSAPTIIHGSKDLAIKLSKLQIDRSRQYFIVTGDVVAFYPSIPIELCIDIVVQLYSEFYLDGVAPNSEEHHEALMEAQVFIKCLQLGNRNLITQFMQKHYLQARGLAMGVADSPDLANLFGWFYERECDIMHDERVPFYGRYIDDCFAIVYAHSELEAINIISQVKFTDCVIEWNAGNSSPFLDMSVYIDDDKSLQHMPYRKSRNHQERIPWISHHPLDVKRGTFIGEMSRLATLSSKFMHYKDAITSLTGLYIARGYPSDLVYSWLKSNIKERWEKRINVEKREHADVLVLKSSFNTAWNYFNAKELGDKVLGYWREWLHHAETRTYNDEFHFFDGNLYDLGDCAVELTTPLHTSDGLKNIPDVRKLDILNRRMIVSRKRTRNLFDLTSLWKKTVLHQYEQDVLPSTANDEDVAHDSDSVWESEDERDPRNDPNSLEFVAAVEDLFF